ncbi:MAG: napA 1 [Firmicutes bacterium]|nr:napA 1 [Bacillota bacterium]
MEMINLTINGLSTQASKGTSVLDAARSVGINIPTLCHLADLTPEGSCRICVVEVEGARGLVTACTYPVSEGMTVRTNSAVIREARKSVVELMLANHPQECLTCQRKLEKLNLKVNVANLPLMIVILSSLETTISVFCVDAVCVFVKKCSVVIP